MFAAPTLARLSALALIATTAVACGAEDGNDKTDAKKATSVTVVTHDSFALPEELTKKFETDTGLKLKLLKQGDVGTLVNKLVLTKDSPLADAVYGIDNTFASRAVDEGVLADVENNAPEAYDLEGDGADQLAAVDYSDVCVNIDDTWFESRELPKPASFDDLAKPMYKDMLATPGATSSSPGLAFLIATIAAKGEGWQDYWKKLVANGAEITSGWTEAYEGQFTQGGGKGKRPIVVSYSSSPPFTIAKATGKPTTSALLDTCFRQVEYAGVLEGAENPDGAEQFVEFMQSDEVQKALPDSMYVYPVADVPLPAAWAKFATPAEKPWEMSADDIAAKRTEWLREWRDIATN